ncbi:hypothetical protein FA13DRAFT_329166 [Coprinellus micaceus]|uniref:Uncharacterized protein n=1 Tax=Coprinellus micaceus TaxID=71717 RepID=A0A4Y7SE69_COPMI|nr:hypothetical protein FA13DRAFT_329166 [Coprinellus micaceus]
MSKRTVSNPSRLSVHGLSAYPREKRPSGTRRRFVASTSPLFDSRSCSFRTQAFGLATAGGCGLATPWLYGLRSFLQAYLAFLPNAPLHFCSWRTRIGASKSCGQTFNGGRQNLAVEIAYSNGSKSYSASLPSSHHHPTRRSTLSCTLLFSSLPTTRTYSVPVPPSSPTQSTVELLPGPPQAPTRTIASLYRLLDRLHPRRALSEAAELLVRVDSTFWWGRRWGQVPFLSGLLGVVFGCDSSHGLTPARRRTVDV